jgi:tol-pal system beta propeller repeat protein TolB
MNKLQSRMKISTHRILLGLAASLAFAPAIGAQTRPKPQRPVDVPPAVVVLPVDTTAGDSIRTIIHRDLDFGDRVQPVLLDSAVAADVWHPGKRSINFGPLKETRAKFAVRLRPISTGLRVEIFDVARQKLLQAGSFRLPRIPRDRSKTLRDSLDRAVATRAATVRARLAADSVALDTLARAAARPVPLERPSQRTAARIAAAARDSVREVIERRAVTLREASERDVARADSIYSVAMSRDSIVRDSLYREGRLAVHGISDELERWVTGTRGSAQTRIVFIDRGKLKIIDSDGANLRTLPTVGAALSPSWHPAGHSIVYVDADDVGTRIAQFDLRTNKSEMLRSSPKGMNISPVYTRDGKSIVWASGSEGPAELLLASANGGDSTVKRFVGRTGFETTSPTFSPDGKQVAFISPRPLTPQVYVMNVDGTRLRLLTPVVAGKRSYRTSPDWSPNGEEVAFMQQMGDFQIWTINVRDRVMKQLTTEGENEDPSWAPDGRHLSITTRRGEIGGDRNIWVLDTRTGRMRQLTTTNDARLSDWSPILKPNF